MLDVHGFASELNGTNIFMIRDGILYTPFADACLPGITRSLVIELAAEMTIPFYEKNISLVELYNADEVFCTGTMGELTPIVQLDGRMIENKSGKKTLTALQGAFEKKIPLLSVSLF